MLGERVLAMRNAMLEGWRDGSSSGLYVDLVAECSRVASELRQTAVLNRTAAGATDDDRPG